jgi:Protein of unknown function (DUF3667)
MSHKKGKLTPYCLNCHYPTDENDSFCPNCGQKHTDGRITLHDLTHEFVHSITHFDGKIFTTLKYLVLPGKLTDEFIKGHHKRYAHPIQLFIVLCGISLLFSGKETKKTSESLFRRGIKNEQVYLKNALFELDSIVNLRNFPLSVKDSFHAIFKDKNLDFEAKKTDKELSVDIYNNTVGAISRNDHDLNILLNFINTKKDTIQNFTLNRAIAIHQQRLAFLRTDSVRLRNKFIEEFPSDSARVSNSFAKDVGMAIAKSVFLKKETEEIKEILHYSDTVSPMSIIQSFENYSQLARQIESDSIKRDSSLLRFSSSKKELKIDDRDFINLSFKELAEKYQIHNTFDKFQAKIYFTSLKNGQDVYASYTSKRIYVYLVLMLPVGLFMMFLYRHQHRLFVEHVVFLIHFFCLSFFLDIPNYFFYNEGTNDYFEYGRPILEYFIILPLALKRVYKQGWGKTILKSLLLAIVTLFSIIIVFFLGILLSLSLA